MVDGELKTADGKAPASAAATIDNKPGRAIPIALIGALLGAIALLGGGVVLGWSLGANRDAALPVPSSSATFVEVPAALPPGAVMPDLRGLESQAALQILSDLGVPAAKVKVTESPAAGPAGRVFAQNPTRGSAIAQEVSLVLSSAAVVPKVVGGGLDEATRQLSLLGAEVAITRTYQPGAAPGTVLATDPAVGAALPARVSLTVADASTSVFLVKARPKSGSYSTRDAALGGQTYVNSAFWSVPKAGRGVAWVVGKHVDGLSAMVGIPDDGNPGDKVEVVVLADGKGVAKVTASFGAPAPLFVTLTGATLVEIVAKPIATTSTSGSVTVVLGEGRLIGGPDLARQLGSQP